MFESAICVEDCVDAEDYYSGIYLYCVDFGLSESEAESIAEELTNKYFPEAYNEET